MRFLLLGYGSIGTKHAGILRDMGHEVVTVDPDSARGADYQSLPQDTTVYDGVLDCTPSDVREVWKFGSQNDIALFVEKPIGNIPHSFGTNKDFVWMVPQCEIQVGFCYHYLPSLAQFVNTIKQEPLSHLLIIGGMHLQAWHEQDYRTRKYWGVATDSLPHSLYVARWILGDMRLLGSYTGRFSDLEIENEDVAGCLLLSRSGVPCYCEVDYLREPRLFRIEVVTSSGTWHEWKFDPAEAPVMYQQQMEAWVRRCGVKTFVYIPTCRTG